MLRLRDARLVIEPIACRRNRGGKKRGPRASARGPLCKTRKL